MTEKLLFTGKTHNTSGRDGGTISQDGTLELKLTQPHPAAENLFGAAWSACYLGAIELAALQRKVKLPAGRRSIPRSISTSTTAPISCVPA